MTSMDIICVLLKAKTYLHYFELCVCLCVRIDWCVRRGRDIVSLGARDTSGCELPEVGAGS